VIERSASGCSLILSLHCRSPKMKDCECDLRFDVTGEVKKKLGHRDFVSAN